MLIIPFNLNLFYGALFGIIAVIGINEIKNKICCKNK